MEILLITLGLILLIWGADCLLKASVDISLRLRISKIVIGMTVVSFVTSTPELIISIQSAIDGFPNLVLGNVIGSNIANLTLVLATASCFGTIDVEKSFYKVDWPVMILSSSILYFFIVHDEILSRWEGVFLVSCLIFFLIFIMKKVEKKIEITELKLQNRSIFRTLLLLFIAMIGFWVGSELLVKGAVDLAKKIGVSDRIIGCTLISVGTSIPELAASIIAVIKKEKSISLGNLIGSNIFNILAVLGITSIIVPIKNIDPQIMKNDMYWMLGISFFILPLCFLSKRLKFDFKKGLLLLMIYLLFIFTIF